MDINGLEERMESCLDRERVEKARVQREAFSCFCPHVLLDQRDVEELE